MADEAVLKRIMPHSMEAEQAVIGSMIMDAGAIEAVTDMLTGEDFYAKQNGLLFDAMKELYEEKKPVDIVTLSERLKEKDAPEEMTGTEFIKELLNAVPTSANVKHYAEIVYEKSMLRQLIKASEGIASECYSDNEDFEVILENSEKAVFDLLKTRQTRDFVPIREVVFDVLKKIEEAANMKGDVTGLSTGYRDLDYKTTGLQKSDFVLVAARPSMGKTAFALSIAANAAFKQKKTVAIFSLEMSKEQLVNRLLAMESMVDAQNIRTGNLTDDQWSDLMAGAETVGASKMIIDDTPGITVSEMRSKCRKYKLDNPDLSLVIVDYIQLMSSGGRTESRQQEVSDISRALKALARELDVPVVVLSQLNRAADSRADHRPMLADIRESGAIEQDADLIMFLYRDDYYNPDTDKPNVCEVIIAKQRNGPIGTVELGWQPKYTRFVALAHEDRK